MDFKNLVWYTWDSQPSGFSEVIVDYLGQYYIVKCNLVSQEIKDVTKWAYCPDWVYSNRDYILIQLITEVAKSDLSEHLADIIDIFEHLRVRDVKIMDGESQECFGSVC